MLQVVLGLHRFACTLCLGYRVAVGLAGISTVETSGFRLSGR